MGTPTFDTASLQVCGTAGESRADPSASFRVCRGAEGRPSTEALESWLATRSNTERVERKLIEHDGKFALLQGMLAAVLAAALADFAKQIS
jgi:hypothetical protein